MLSCKDVAKYFLSLNEEDAGDVITNLKLQKLVYYAQGFYLAMYNEPLFIEPIEAWAHGPVVPDLYHSYKIHGSGSIPYPTDIDLSIYDDKTIELLNEVYAVYGQYSAWKLRELTHEEPTWSQAENSFDNIISHDAMIDYFKTRLN